MNVPLKIQVTDNQEQTVSGRELHAFLEIETPYTKWFERMLQYGFVAEQDYTDKNVRYYKVILVTAFLLDFKQGIIYNLSKA